ncbi:hypothetical protein PoB_007428100 [Plakobranchus ocellatus]|uniref:Uncharacterized protein n=1 Tax=Plakobranchus ocellatus TaxID=259542 RepID=A0AAV4DVC8_9GAST|nr:hypothetical protein PoB_007428100 [Plakobranchus ocellatus]
MPRTIKTLLLAPRYLDQAWDPAYVLLGLKLPLCASYFRTTIYYFRRRKQAAPQAGSGRRDYVATRLEEHPTCAISCLSVSDTESTVFCSEVERS